MKRILIVHTSMELGGAETSLLGLLDAFDYQKNSIYLFLYELKGELLRLIPKDVHILKPVHQYTALVSPIKCALFSGHIGVAVARLSAKTVCVLKNRKHHFNDYGYIVKQNSHYYALPLLPQFGGQYDFAISFMDPHFILNEKVSAKVKLGWLHTDFSLIDLEQKLEEKMWQNVDYAVNVSNECKAAFDKKHPGLENKSIVIENILSLKLINESANKFEPIEEMSEKGIRLLSIGRYCKAKNFDNVPDICARLVRDSLDVRWYIIGFGGDEELIRQKIAEAHMEEHVILLGKKENPYPYIKACDLYVQPSRYEGKSVAVREAQILCKPVVITDYPTSAGQLENGVDGVIVPMDNEGCAVGIAALLRDPARMQMLSENCSKRDYTNAQEINKLYALMEKEL